MGDTSEHLDEFGDVPPIELADDPLAIVPSDELKLVGEIMVWSAYIEADLFMLFLVAYPGEAERRRRQFYRDARGLHARAQLVRRSYDGRSSLEIMQSLDQLIAEIGVLGKFRNDIAHNPLIRFGPKKLLVRWVPGSGDGAGDLIPFDASVIRRVLPAIRKLHDDLRKVAALLNSPSGGSFAIAFGGTDERTEARIARYIAAANDSPE